MKKIIFFFIAMFAVSITMTSCKDDDNDTIVFSNTPEKDAAGVYKGIFERTMVGAAVPDTTYAEGTLTFSADSAYVANIAFDCPDFSITAECPTNIAHSDNGFAFSNNLATNALGAPMFGRIDNDKNIKTYLQLKIRSGRSVKTYNLVFRGKKVSE